jgi:hypothetical protein
MIRLHSPAFCDQSVKFAVRYQDVHDFTVRGC